MHGKLQLLWSNVVDYGRDYVGSIFLLLIAGICKRMFTYLSRRLGVQKDLTTKGDTMEKVLVDGKEFDMKLVISGGLVKIVGDYAGSGGAAKLEAGVSVDYFIDELKAKIPGQIDDAVLEIVKAALKAL